MRISLTIVAIATLFGLQSSLDLEAARESPFPDSGKGYFTFYLDNDLFAGRDQNYTNGVRLSWISENRRIEDLGSIQRFLRQLSGDPDSFAVFRNVTGFRDPENIAYNFGFSITQLMFTPEDSIPTSQPFGQRRYAGWLGLGFSLHVKDGYILNSIEVAVGTTGPNSLAEKAQDFVHDVRGIQKFNGWADQIPNELTLDLSFVQKRRAGFVEADHGDFSMDGITEWGARLGSFQTAAHLGGFFRLGYNLPPDFSDPRLSSTAYSHRYFQGASEYNGPWSIYCFFGATAQGVLHDATLDGPLFRNFETGNTREPFRRELFSGFGIRFSAIEFSYVHSWRSREFKTQRERSSFGSVAVRYRWH